MRLCLLLNTLTSPDLKAHHGREQLSRVVGKFSRAVRKFPIQCELITQRWSLPFSEVHSVYD